jgi:hypothetical protein
MAENPEQYAKLANEGLLLGYPVKIGGAESRPDNGIHYHSSIKFFDPSKDHAHAVHHIAQYLSLNPPDAKNTQIEPGMFKDRLGNDVYVLKMKGNSAEKIKEHNGKFAHMGFPANYEYTPHISVDKETHDRIKNSGAKTAHEAGIEFGPAKLFRGQQVLKTYRHEPDSADSKFPDQSDMTAKIPYAPTKMDKTETPLEKGLLQNAGVAMSMAGALAGSHSGPAQTADRPPQVQAAVPSYNHQRMLQAIAQVESSGGKNINHVPTSSGTAYGKWALMPNTIHDTIKGHKDLKTKYGKALALNGTQLQRFMHDNRGLEDVIADRHLAHIEHNFGNDTDRVGFAWNQGISGTKNAKNKGVDVSSHPYTKKIRDAYGKVK